jgi:hypothetical protein
MDTTYLQRLSISGRDDTFVTFAMGVGTVTSLGPAIDASSVATMIYVKTACVIQHKRAFIRIHTECSPSKLLNGYVSFVLLLYCKILYCIAFVSNCKKIGRLEICSCLNTPELSMTYSYRVDLICHIDSQPPCTEGPSCKLRPDSTWASSTHH